MLIFSATFVSMSKNRIGALVAIEREFADRFVRVHRNCLVARGAIRGFERVAAGVHPLFEVIATDSGPAAVTAAVEVHPWAAILAASAGPWDNAKTMKCLLALRCVDRLRIVPLSLVAAGGEQALAAALRRELGKAPFSIALEEPQITVSVAESFATSCTEPLARAVRGAIGSHVMRVVFDIPSHALTARAVAALQALIDSLR